MAPRQGPRCVSGRTSDRENRSCRVSHQECVAVYRLSSEGLHVLRCSGPSISPSWMFSALPAHLRSLFGFVPNLCSTVHICERVLSQEAQPMSSPARCGALATRRPRRFTSQHTNPVIGEICE